MKNAPNIIKAKTQVEFQSIVINRQSPFARIEFKGIKGYVFYATPRPIIYRWEQC